MQAAKHSTVPEEQEEEEEEKVEEEEDPEQEEDLEEEEDPEEEEDEDPEEEQDKEAEEKDQEEEGDEGEGNSDSTVIVLSSGGTRSDNPADASIMVADRAITAAGPKVSKVRFIAVCYLLTNYKFLYKVSFILRYLQWKPLNRITLGQT